MSSRTTDTDGREAEGGTEDTGARQAAEREFLKGMIRDVLFEVPGFRTLAERGIALDAIAYPALVSRGSGPSEGPVEEPGRSERTERETAGGSGPSEGSRGAGESGAAGSTSGTSAGLSTAVAAPLGTMPAPEALVGLPCTDDLPPAGSRGAIGGSHLSGRLAEEIELCPQGMGLGAGAYVGDGLPLVPGKLVAKIRKWEFVEMGELLPEFWASPRDSDGDLARERRSRQARKVTNIFTWLQCYGTLVAVIAPAEPTVVPELMAYMCSIIRFSQDYEGLGWVRYDSAFRRQAALSGNRRWSVINWTLFTMTITGRAAGPRRCELCFATSHSERECAQSGNPDPDMEDRLRSLETAVLAMARPLTCLGEGSCPVRPSDVCRKWNTTGCSFPRCKYRHKCSRCGGSHPEVRCGGRGDPIMNTSMRMRGGPYQ